MNTSRHYFARAGALALTGIAVLIALLITQQWLAVLMIFVGWELGYLHRDFAGQGFARKMAEDQAQAIRDRADELTAEKKDR
jgi:hypothetical protein